MKPTFTCGQAPWNMYIHSRKNCTESKCKYPVTCKHHNTCMEKLVLAADKRRNLTKALLVALIPLAAGTAQAKPPVVYHNIPLRVISGPTPRVGSYAVPGSHRWGGFSMGGNSKIASIAKRDLGTYFRRGQSYQCANYVSHVVKRAGGSPPRSSAMARAWLKWGRPVSLNSMRAGDIIVTSRGSNPSSGHIMIYKGNGVAIHRSTYCTPIQEIRVSVYKHRILGVRRHS